MSGQLTPAGAQSLVNAIGGVVPPYIGTSAPVWQPGLFWIDTASGAVLNYWNGTAWIAGTEPLYIALLTSDPSLSGPNGGYAQNISDLIEDTTSGYARQSVTFTAPVPYSATTPYTLGEQVTYEGYVYTCAVANTGTAPTGAQTNNADWTYVSPAYPASASNSNVLTYTYSASQVYPVAWAALVTAATGTTGLLKYLWTLPEPQQVSASQSIQIGVGMAVLSQS